MSRPPVLKAAVWERDWFVCSDATQLTCHDTLGQEDIEPGAAACSRTLTPTHTGGGGDLLERGGGGEGGPGEEGGGSRGGGEGVQGGGVPPPFGTYLVHREQKQGTTTYHSAHGNVILLVANKANSSLQVNSGFPHLIKTQQIQQSGTFTISCQLTVIMVNQN